MRALTRFTACDLIPMKPDDLDLRRREGPRGQARWFRYTSASALGLEIAVAIIGSALVGRWAENHWTHWSPWTTLIGLAIGCGAAGLAVTRTIREQRAWERTKDEGISLVSPSELHRPTVAGDVKARMSIDDEHTDSP